MIVKKEDGLYIKLPKSFNMENIGEIQNSLVDVLVMANGSDLREGSEMPIYWTLKVLEAFSFTSAQTHEIGATKDFEKILSAT